MEAIDVGQGDSLLVITPDGKTLLIDGGGFGGGPHQAPQDFDIGEEVVSEALWSRGIRHLDAVALTHAHSDHMGGLPAVLRNFHPAEFWVGNNPHFAAYNALLNEAADLHIRVRTFRAGDALSLRRRANQRPRALRDYQPGPEPTNNDSLVMRIAYGATSVLLEGDAEAPIEDAMVAQSSNPAIASEHAAQSRPSRQPHLHAPRVPRPASLRNGPSSPAASTTVTAIPARKCWKSSKPPHPHLLHRHQRRRVLPAQRQNRCPGANLWRQVRRFVQITASSMRASGRVGPPPASPTRRGMKLCPIHRTSLFLSDGWESIELHDDVVFH